HTKSQTHRHQKRPRTGQLNDPILDQRINHDIEHRKSQPHRQRPRPAGQPTPRPTTTPTTSNTLVEHTIDTDDGHGQATRRPTPRPATTPTTSNTNEAHAIDHNDDHQQATSRPSNNQPHVCGVGHPGEAGGVTPGRGRDNNPTHSPRHRAPTRTNTHARALDPPTVNALYNGP